MKKIVLVLMLININNVDACEPASINWKNVYHQMYPNTIYFDKETKIKYENFRKISHFDPYAWPKDKKYRSNDGKLNLFNDLDKNKDKEISEDEFSNIYIFLPNPCQI